jgi:hypothetical protein
MGGWAAEKGEIVMSAWIGCSRLGGIVLAASCGLALLGATGAAAETKTFGYTGTEQEFTVPPGVTSVHVVALGSQGGSTARSAAGGLGAVVSGNLSVAPGQVLYVEVGGVPFNGGGSSTSEGGAGGGASDVRTMSIGAEPSPGGEASLLSRLLVAAGGGGGGETGPFGCPGGVGGNAAENGATGTNCGFRGGGGGGAGTAIAGGEGGTSYSEEAPVKGSLPNGEPGRRGIGGTGPFAGGGGGGLYGGGGGGFQDVSESGPGIPNRSGGDGGGGGGSNLVPIGGESGLAKLGEAASVTFTYEKPTPSVATTVKDGSGNPVSNEKPATVGTTAHDTATLSGEVKGASFDGSSTVTYHFYANNECKPSSSDQTVTVEPGGIVPDSAAQTLGPGAYSYSATYSGNANYNAATSPCEPFKVEKAASVVATTVNDGSGNTVSDEKPATVGTSVHDTATLSGEVKGFSFDGSATVTYHFFANNECKPGSSDQTVTVEANGAVPESASLTLSPGAYSYSATYSGNADYNAASSPCEPFKVKQAEPTVTTSATSPVNVGEKIKDTATLSGLVKPTGEGTVTFKLYADGKCETPPVFSSASGPITANGNVSSGEYPTTAVGTYYWVASFSGDVNNKATSTKCGESGERSVVQSGCPAKPPKLSVRWHYSAEGSSGSWSSTNEANCGQTITMGPQAMEGALKVSPGKKIKAGYDFDLPGNNQPFAVFFGEGKVVFKVQCVSGKKPSEPTFTVALPTQSYSVADSEWHPSGSQSSPLVYQGEREVPNLCGGGQLLLSEGGTFSAYIALH